VKTADHLALMRQGLRDATRALEALTAALAPLAATQIVHLVLMADGRVSSIWREADDAGRAAAELNAHPGVDGDPDAPYSVQTWVVGQ
jgi:phage-related minor tail protein